LDALGLSTRAEKLGAVKEPYSLAPQCEIAALEPDPGASIQP